MRAQALQIAPYALPLKRGVRMGRVHSVFSTSFNVLADERLVHVGPQDALMSATGVSVSPADMKQLLAGLRAGDIVASSEGRVRIYKRESADLLDLGCATVCNCSIPLAASHLSAAWAQGCLARLPLRRGCGLYRDAQARACLQVLADPNRDASELLTAARYLVGRGPGLTPSGDDILMGYTCARWAFGCAGSLPVYIADATRARSTEVSASYAEALRHGWVSPIYRDLICAAGLRDEQTFDRAARTIGQIGHTSGTDALLGLSIGFSYVTARAASPIHRAMCA